MKKIIVTFLVITIMLLTLSSCQKGNNNQVNSNLTNVNNLMNNKDKIQLWYYIDVEEEYSEDVLKIIESAKTFCDINNIPLEIHGYNKDVLSQNDYILKRNIAAANGNMIIIDEVRNLRALADHHADYSKLINYTNLLSAYKDRYCIPLGINYRANYIENEAMLYYGIIPEKPLITYVDFLEIKQVMKENGAKFELNSKEFIQLADYYLNINELLFVGEESNILIDNDKYKEMLKKTIFSVCNDILLYNDVNLEIENKDIKSSALTYHIDDKNSGLTLTGDSIKLAYTLINPYNIGAKDISNTSFYIAPYYISSPNFYMYNKITNEKIYDLANHIVGEETYLMLETWRSMNGEAKLRYVPVFNVEKAKGVLQVDDDLKYIGKYNGNSKAKDIVNLAYEIFVKDEDKLKEMANMYFCNFDYMTEIRFFIREIVYDIAHKLSGDNLSLENFDSKDEEVNKMLDEKINEFVTNFIMHNN